MWLHSFPRRRLALEAKQLAHIIIALRLTICRMVFVPQCRKCNNNNNYFCVFHIVFELQWILFIVTIDCDMVLTNFKAIIDGLKAVIEGDSPGFIIPIL